MGAPPVTVPPSDDPRAPVFFLSYSRPDRSKPAGPPQEPNKHVKALFDELTANVNELIGSPAGYDPGYLDLGQDGGAKWQQGVLEAAGTCRILVCLLSRPYLFQSTWCPIEWDVFARRRVLRRSDGRPGVETAIAPVLWTPFHEELPKPVAEVNMFTPTGLPNEDYSAQYRANGLYGLIRTEQMAIYHSIVWKLAMHIQRIHNDYWVEPDVPTGIEHLRTSFTEGAA
jgi:hypothetical protein